MASSSQGTAPAFPSTGQSLRPARAEPQTRRRRDSRNLPSSRSPPHREFLASPMGSLPRGALVGVADILCDSERTKSSRFAELGPEDRQEGKAGILITCGLVSWVRKEDSVGRSRHLDPLAATTRLLLGLTRRKGLPVSVLLWNSPRDCERLERQQATILV